MSSLKTAVILSVWLVSSSHAAESRCALWIAKTQLLLASQDPENFYLGTENLPAAPFKKFESGTMEAELPGPLGEWLQSNESSETTAGFFEALVYEARQGNLAINDRFSDIESTAAWNSKHLKGHFLDNSLELIKELNPESVFSYVAQLKAWMEATIEQALRRHWEEGLIKYYADEHYVRRDGIQVPPELLEFSKNEEGREYIASLYSALVNFYLSKTVSKEDQMAYRMLSNMSLSSIREKLSIPSRIHRFWDLNRLEFEFLEEDLPLANGKIPAWMREHCAEDCLGRARGFELLLKYVMPSDKTISPGLASTMTDSAQGSYTVHSDKVVTGAFRLKFDYLSKDQESGDLEFPPVVFRAEFLDFQEGEMGPEYSLWAREN